MVVILILVFAGGALGSLARELLSPALPTPWDWLPTLLINVAACFAIGWLYSLRDRMHTHLMHLAAVGFCGGFSTFSHFTEEVTLLFNGGAFVEAAVYAVLAVGLGLAAAVAGEGIGQRTRSVQEP